MGNLSPVDVAYQSLGKKHPAMHALDTPTRCVRCSQEGISQAVPLDKVASNKFTDWDKLASTSKNAHLCSSCAWAYAELSNRLTRLVITPEKVHFLESNEASAYLFNPEKWKGISVVIPVSGKKHVLPYARWGVLSHDNGELPLTGTLLNQVASMWYLRSVGTSENAIKTREMVLLSTADPLMLLAAWQTIEDLDDTLVPMVLTMARLIDERSLWSRFEENVL